MIKINELTKIYGTGKGSVKAIDNISLDIKKGDIYGIIGLSGAGKSSLIRCINLLEKPTKGSIKINDVDIVKLKNPVVRKIRQKIGMIFQHFNLLSSRTVLENIMLPLEVADIPKDKRLERATELLKLVNLEDKANMYPSQLSGGQKQRVGIARAIANEPDILLCDEATSALDPQTTHSILQLLKSINEKFKITIVLITHEMEVIKTVCNEVAVIEGGHIVEKGRVLDIFTNPKHPTTQTFLGHNDKKLPASVLKDLLGFILSITFLGPSAKEPLVAILQQELNLSPNILWGKIETIQDTTVGHLILHIKGTDDERQKASKLLESKGVSVEVLKHA
ncbi:D-methionine transport system ATP-binding protein [Desulfonispora thiosulfatigenes DSM 11270]|uniref:D-methionine transport system ATP-binding protein n=1 Tax=Desulfonispora thiosulfatigenes DSM 11270 TaxID=656914 RepID=A0A1W1UQT7_DESTI|nr:ATP-binding cassette domain-containing protein [Desulfonispora thiosulfatigenes]SMB83369.1 D-methionine transport system ATP-binding protein [Desulfonispora thiosulfatigenes DSM 11270]